MIENDNKRKAERVAEMATSGNWAGMCPRDEERKEKAEKMKKKLEEQKKWQNIWNGEEEIRKLRIAIEGFKRPTRQDPAFLGSKTTTNSQVYRTNSLKGHAFLTDEEGTTNLTCKRTSIPKKGFRSIYKLK